MNVRFRYCAVFLYSLAFLFLFNLNLEAVEMGFDEEFSLAEDRSVPLKQLIPGTEDYYYYNCLYHQQRGETSQVAGLLRQWLGRYGHSAKYEEIRTRQLLLEHERNPENLWQFLIERLNLQFNHARKETVARKTFESRLPTNWLSYENLKAIALREYNDLSGFKAAGLEKLIDDNLTGDKRRDLLKRLQYPDHEKIAKMVVEDLQHQYSGGFGSLPIHEKLLPEQLEYCSKTMPQLLEQSPFILAWLQKMQPGEDHAWEADPHEKLQILKKMYAFVKPLKPAFNSLKAHLLYHILDLQRGFGSYDRGIFLEYLNLPRNVAYVEGTRLQSEEWRRFKADLNADFRKTTFCVPVGSDEALVRDYLERIMLADKGSEAFSGIIESEYLKRLFAETMIINAVGDLEKWFSLLDGTTVKNVRERIELEFMPACKTFYDADELVKLAVRVKNIKRLMVKIYKLNLANFYRENAQEVTVAVDLDGLVANEELVFDYDQAEYRRHDEIFELASLSGRGVFIVELIGNGISSRAMIRKGLLSYVQRPGAAGHVFTIFDENGEQVKDASIELAGSEYTPDKNGQIVIPFTTRPENRQFVIRHGDFASLQNFQHLSESYNLEASIHVEREALVAGKVATVVVRPALSINGFPADLGILKEVSLLITSTDRDGVESTREVKDLKLLNDRDIAFEFKTPDKLKSISFALRALVDNLSKNTRDSLRVSRSFSLNGIDQTEKTSAFFIRRENGEYIAELLGKTGEPCSDNVVNLEIDHSMIRRKVAGTLQTDEKGCIFLGRLEEVEKVTLMAQDGVKHEFVPSVDANSIPDTICSPQGQNILVPFAGELDRKITELCSLFEVRNGSLVKDCRADMSLEPGFVVLKNLAAGDYELFFKKQQHKVVIKVAAGKQFNGYVVSRRRALPLNNALPMQIVEAQTQKNGILSIKLRNAGKKARVHILASSFVPEHDAFKEFTSILPPPFPETLLAKPWSLYVSGRNIGDEYRYILERRFASVLPGNMLKRPGLLLNPWNLRKTDTGTQSAAEGNLWAGAPEGKMRSAKSDRSKKSKDRSESSATGFASFDFLTETALVAANLVPDSDGTVKFDLQKVKNQKNLRIVAVDGFDVACRDIEIAAEKAGYRDLRLQNALSPEAHFSQQKNISVVLSGAELEVTDASSARVEIYDNLKSVYRLLATINPDENFAQFGFITDWQSFDSERKKELYSKYSCHELNFFIYHHDQKFFVEVISPYIANKRDKTFMDKWLLKMDLKDYLDPWRFARLNIVEKILLGMRIPDASASINRYAGDLFDLLPENREAFNRLFRTALQGSALDSTAADMKPREELGSKSGIYMDIPSPAPMVQMERSARAPSKSSRFADSESVDDFDGGLIEESVAEYGYEEDSARRNRVQQLFRQVDTTEELVENNYYQLPIEHQSADLVKVNAFWRDYAVRDHQKPFVSGNFIFAAENFTEMMLALSVLSLPFNAESHKIEQVGSNIRFRAGSNAIVFHEEIKTAKEGKDTASILTGQNFFAQNDRYHYEKNERFDKFVTEEFLTRVVYGCQVVVTNPTSSRRKVDVLMQIPEGALPVLNSAVTKSIHLLIEPYSTQTSEYFFYFPQAGHWKHYPVHVSENETMLATTKGFVFNVVDELTNFDKTSWPWISQNGSDAEVLEFLAENNIGRLDLSQMAFRLKDRDFFVKTYELLKKRHCFNPVVWSYGLKHGYLNAIREYLPHTVIANQVGSSFSSELLTIEPVEWHTYQHREYWPLVNARVYKLGKKREILNQQLGIQYKALIDNLRYQASLSDYDCLAVTYYLLVQERIEEAAGFFAKIKDPQLTATIQYHYMKAYLAFSHQQIDEAVAIAKKYENYPVLRWRHLFADVIAQAAEIAGEGVSGADLEDRDQQQRILAAAQPDLELTMENRKVSLRHRNVKTVSINYYLMDIELLFSRKPFVQEISGQFSIVSPNHSEKLSLENKPETIQLEIPGQFKDRNMMIEVVAGGLRRTVVSYPHSLAVSMVEAYGQLQVRQQQTGKPIPGAYVKVYARHRDGSVAFYKDGYTDLRGRFDYASLSTSQLDQVEKFSLLIMSDSAGSLIREASPPNR